MWHAVPPDEDEPVTFKGSIQSKLTDDQWDELLTPGSPLNRRWQAQVDVIAGFLAQLRDARVPVLWRPYHEMNGDWFWWSPPSPSTLVGSTGSRVALSEGVSRFKGRGGAEESTPPTPSQDRVGSQTNGYAALWRMLFDRLVRHHGLDNLIWVWNANALRGSVRPYADLYPGHDTVDILATDIYGADYRQAHYDDLAALAEGRPIAIGECGEVPTPDVVDSQPRWAWFMVWTSLLTHSNTPEAIRAIYNYPRALKQPARAQWSQHLAGQS